MSFTNEMLVRQRGLMRLFEEVPSDLLNRAIQIAHSRVLESTTGISELDPPNTVVEAETEFALAEALRTLAVSREVNRPQYNTSDLSLDGPGSTQRFLMLADMEENRAWSRLQPYLKRPAPIQFGLERPVSPADQDD